MLRVISFYGQSHGASTTAACDEAAENEFYEGEGHVTSQVWKPADVTFRQNCIQIAIFDLDLKDHYQ